MAGMTGQTSSQYTRAAIIAALEQQRDACEHHWPTEAEQFDVERAADGIERGQVQPDYNRDDDGQPRLTDPLQALAHGAFMSSGDWWNDRIVSVVLP